jgi:TonB family protein
MGYQALLFCPDEKLASVVSQVFSELDFTVEAVREPFAAVKKLMAQRYDALVVDSENEQNASLLFKSARNSSCNQGSLAIAVAEGQMGVAKAYRMGANLVLTKPINVEQAKGTLRVARGLLRKSSDTAGASAGTTPPAIPAKAAPDAATSSFHFANPGAAMTAAPMSVPELEAPLPAMSAETMLAEVLEEIPAATASAKVEDRPAVAPVPAAQTQITVASTPPPERRKSVYPANTVAASVPTQNPSYTSNVVSGSAVAAAPAKEVSVSPAIKTQIVEAEPAKPSQDPAHDAASVPTWTFSSGSAGDGPSFAALDEKESDGAHGGKKTLVVAAAVLALVALGYLGYGYLVKSSPSSRPASAPQNSEQPALRPMSSPVAAPAKTTPDLASLTTQPSTSKTATAASGNPSTGATKSPVTRIAADLAAGNALNIAAPGAANSEPETQKADAAPMVVKSHAATAKKQAQDEESAPPLSAPVVVASANDSNLNGLMSSASSNIPQPAFVALKVSQGVSQGLLIKRVTPKYPPAALRLHTDGAVQIEATINKEGNVTNLKVLSGSPVLAQAALEAVRQWRYKPYYLDGAPVEIQTQITVNFKAN